MEFIANLFPGSFQPSLQPASTCMESHGAILNALPASHSGLNAVSVNQNLAVIPGKWKNGEISECLDMAKCYRQRAKGITASSFYDVTPTEPCVAAAFAEIKNSDFIAFDDAFLDVLGPKVKLERIQTFPHDQWHVHEAPVYLPETNELLYSDTSLAGLLYAINIDTHEVRKILSGPPLQNVNGGTYYRGKVCVATNGGLGARDFRTQCNDRSNRGHCQQLPRPTSQQSKRFDLRFKVEYVFHGPDIWPGAELARRESP